MKKIFPTLVAAETISLKEIMTILQKHFRSLNTKTVHNNLIILKSCGQPFFSSDPQIFSSSEQDRILHDSGMYDVDDI